MKNYKNHTQPDDAPLIAAMLAGKESAFEKAVTLYHHQMLSIACAIIGEAFAEEIVQDAWISAIKALPEFAGQCRLNTWLVQITANAAKTRLRREKRQIPLKQDEYATVQDDRFDGRQHWREQVSLWEIETPESLLENEQLSQVISQAYENLPATQQAVLMLYDLQQTSLPEICNILDISASNARVLLHRARSAIQQRIAHYQDTV